MQCWLRRCFFCLVAAGFIFLFQAQASLAFATTSADGQQSPEDVKAVFLRRIKNVADSGKLFDPHATASILDLHFNATAYDNVKRPVDCSDPLTQALKSAGTKLAATDSSWYRPLPTGEGHVFLPRVFINPEMTTGDAKLSYSVGETIWCPNSSSIQKRTSAQLSFGDLPSFACILPSDIKAVIPQAEFVRATDGVSLVTYDGHLDSRSSTTVRFEYRLGVRCALGVNIMQDTEGGLRVLWAKAAFSRCEQKVRQTFCASHAHLTWRDSDYMSDMDAHVRQVCGTANTFYLREGLHREKPAPVTLLVHATINGPCGS
jgi:hypothetical protein